MSRLPIDEVGQLLMQLADTLVLPRFRHLQTGEVEEKSPGELVTIVDREVEAVLNQQLPKLLVGSRVVGEEAVATNPRLLDNLDHGWVWLVDPLDGTSSFAAGRDDFSLMLALLRDGETLASWIYAPVSRQLCVAEAGGGAWRNGQRLTVRNRPVQHHAMAKTRFLPDSHKAALNAAAQAGWRFDEGYSSAGISYPALIDGEWDGLLFWRTLPWDHAPSELLLREAGGELARLDGRRYRASSQQAGLLAAQSPRAWQALRAPLP